MRWVVGGRILATQEHMREHQMRIQAHTGCKAIEENDVLMFRDHGASKLGGRAPLPLTKLAGPYLASNWLRHVLRPRLVQYKEPPT